MKTAVMLESVGFIVLRCLLSDLKDDHCYLAGTDA